MAIQLVREIRKNLSDDLIVEVSHVFKFPTISGISEAIVSVSNSEKNEHIIELGEYRNLDKPPLFLFTLLKVCLIVTTVWKIILEIEKSSLLATQD